MEKTQEHTINFTCVNAGCQHVNTYTLKLIAGDSAEGAESQVLRCKNCGTENVIKLTGYRFPPNNVVLRGAK